MATNLHALIRYKTINKCLRNKESVYNWEALSIACVEALRDADLLPNKANEFKISRRTIFLDIEHMKNGMLGYNAPIEYDRKEKGFYYTDSKFSIDYVPIKKEDMEELNKALLLLKQFSGKSNLKGLENIITNLEETLNIRSRKGKEIIQFEYSLNHEGQKWLNVIYDAIKNKRSLNINYQPFKKEKINYILSPYLLKEFNSRWFLFGKLHNTKENHKLTHITLDRIKECIESLHGFEESLDFDPESHLNDIIGVTFTPGEIKQEIIFKAYSLQADYIETKPIHESQKIIEKADNYTRFSIQVIPNFEMESRLFSFGEKVIVESPKNIVLKMKERALEMYKLYNQL